MTACIIIGILALIVGAIIGWKSRGWVDDFNADLDRIFYEALKDYNL